ncbi:TetR/AcrR family transcriptional regulator [Saccharomonospora viridis]|jgi:AcrR family transcriptional regulator|uniref:Transcriptional regulator, tetR family n=2 Tax=Saccharomonospora viridis TaxID=1852 RepID=C7MW13_SACVD|nr:TetR/AcrR family transcriptional regulator [Saccharomonospora viridis]ACU97113.1 transcriptional regulator, tetR family [Saccharomonospora viridis DSM 43017]KHF43352.1 transcriptional regulator, tetR family [Saccharomonospora viridis]SFO80167.1 transcriptional regulator, TetR family [Saccharomonospora viridis]
MVRADATLNRQRLVLAVRDAVAEEGPGVSVRDIADRAGVGVTTLYRHFPSKQALLDAPSIDRWATLARLAGQAVAGRGSLPEIVDVLDGLTRMVSTDRGFIAALDLEVGHTPSTIRPWKHRFDRHLAALWVAAQRRGELRRYADPHDVVELAGMIRDPRRRERMMLTLVNGICAEGVDTERLLRRRSDTAMWRAVLRSL